MTKGWHRESKRHSLAARGIETGSRTASSDAKMHSSVKRDVPISERIDIMQAVIGFGDANWKYFPSPYGVEEGIHYECLAYTDWADTMVATVVKWRNGKVDDFSDLDASIKNATESVEIVKGEPQTMEKLQLMLNRRADAIRKAEESQKQLDEQRRIWQKTREAGVKTL